MAVSGGGCVRDVDKGSGGGGEEDGGEDAGGAEAESMGATSAGGRARASGGDWGGGGAGCAGAGGGVGERRAASVTAGPRGTGSATEESRGTAGTEDVASAGGAAGARGGARGAGAGPGSVELGLSLEGVSLSMGDTGVITARGTGTVMGRVGSAALTAGRVTGVMFGAEEGLSSVLGAGKAVVGAVAPFAIMSSA